MIPKILHQTSKTGEVVPPWEPLYQKLRDLHPGWEYHHWDDAANDRLISEHYPDLSETYFGMPKPIMKADLIRYVYMDRFGGLYLDTDYEFLKPFDLTDRALVLPRESSADKPLFLGNCVFASVPGHPFWKAVLAELKARPPRRDQLTHEDAIIHLTGPGLLTRIYQEQFAGDPSIFVPEKAWFHPPTPQSDGEYREVARDPGCYGIHFCYGSWRALTWKERLKARWDRMWGR
jgi:mannosyltransferase OCH1-like enzyme